MFSSIQIIQLAGNTQLPIMSSTEHIVFGEELDKRATGQEFYPLPNT